MFDNPYVQNILSEFIVIGLLVGVGVLVFWATRRRALARFFGVGERRRIIVYLSRLAIAPGGALDVEGNPRSFSSIAVPEYEADLIPALRGLFVGMKPGGDATPGLMARLVYDDIELDLRASPASAAGLEHGTPFIAVGSRWYNAASGWIEDARPDGATFDAVSGLIRVEGLGDVGDATTGIVERVKEPHTGQVAFYAAGPSTLGTTGSALFLISSWRDLRKRFGDEGDFCVLLSFPAGDPRSPSIISERRF